MMTFQQAVQQIPSLENAWRSGLQALRPEDKTHIDSEDTRALRGSADIDAAYQAEEPNANRWDFAIAYQHTNRSKEVVYWVELHTASDSQVDTVIRKAEWLKTWFRGGGKILASFEKEILWVSSGSTRFTRHTDPKRRRMAAVGLTPVGTILKIRNEK
jgi:hypothetical protein